MTPKGWSISALAVEFRLDRRTVAGRVADIEPVSETGNAKLYRLADVAGVLVGDGKPADFEDARTRKMSADAILAELEVAKARREVAAIGIIAGVVADEYGAVRAKMLGIPDKMAPILDTTEGADAKRELLRAAIHEALEELSSDRDIGSAIDAASADDGGDSEDGEPTPPAPAKADGKRVVGSVPKTKRGSKRGAGAVDHGKK